MVSHGPEVEGPSGPYTGDPETDIARGWADGPRRKLLAAKAARSGRSDTAQRISDLGLGADADPPTPDWEAIAALLYLGIPEGRERWEAAVAAISQDNV